MVRLRIALRKLWFLVSGRCELPSGAAFNSDGTVSDPIHGGKVYPELQPDRYAELVGLQAKKSQSTVD